MRARILIDILIFCLIFILPWWLTVLLAAAFVFMYDRYAEILVVGFIIDSIYNVPLGGYFHFEFVASLICLIVFVISFLVKRRLRFYS